MIKVKPIVSPSFEMLKYAADYIRKESFSTLVDDSEVSSVACSKCHGERTMFLSMSNLYYCANCVDKQQSCAFVDHLGSNNIKLLKDALKTQSYKAILEHLNYTFLIKKTDVISPGALVGALMKADGIDFKRTFIDDKIIISVNGASLIVLKRVLKSVGIRIKLLDN